MLSETALFPKASDKEVEQFGAMGGRFKSVGQKFQSQLSLLLYLFLF
jgi:hypothetical protein